MIRGRGYDSYISINWCMVSVSSKLLVTLMEGNMMFTSFDAVSGVIRPFSCSYWWFKARLSQPSDVL